jgi:hypothetical protein
MWNHVNRHVLPPSRVVARILKPVCSEKCCFPFSLNYVAFHLLLLLLRYGSVLGVVQLTVLQSLLKQTDNHAAAGKGDEHLRLLESLYCTWSRCRG